MAAESTSAPGARSGRGASRGRGRDPDAHTAQPQAGDPAAANDDIASGLSFRDAQTALEISLAELQASDLDIEEMTSLYQRAHSYAERCEQLLQQVEQEVAQWDPEQPENPPQPFQG